MCQNYLNIKENLIQIKNLFEKLVHILDTEGNNEVYYAKNELMGNISYINEILNTHETNLNEVFVNVKESYKSLYPPRGGLTEFFVWRDDFDERVKENKPLNTVKEEIAAILGI